MLAIPLLFVATIPASATVLEATPIMVAQATSDCQAQIGTLRTVVQSASFSGKNADKEQAGLLGKLEGAETALTAGKNADTVKKLEDFQIKVQDLKASGKIDAASADTLLAGTQQVISCVQASAVTSA